LIVAAGGFGGALPDFDAISLWSKFDVTIGSVFNLQHSGKEIYFGKLWYSHHGAMHSLLAPFCFIFLWLLPSLIWNKQFIWRRLKTNLLGILTFLLAYSAHLIEDMITPASVWGGVNLFFPDPTYVGGFGKIWWWNNYDLVLIICSVIAVNLLLILVIDKSLRLRALSCLVAFAVGAILFVHQINNRPTDFSYEGHTAQYAQFEKQSKEIQRDILGDRLYELMEAIDSKIPLNF
jgi:hypothetical protein